MSHGTPSTPARKSATSAPYRTVEVGYTTRVLVQALFPYRKPEAKEIVARAGNTEITIYSPKGLPYGKYPRLIMAYLITQAVKRKNLPEDEARRIPLGSSMNDFMELMGLTTRGTGGATGSLKTVREQIKRLATSAITIEKIYTDNPDRDTLTNVSIIETLDTWYSHDPDQPTLTESYLELTPRFYREIVTHPVPIDLTLLKSLSKPRAMDIYIWATMRKYAINQTLELSWEQVQAQFGPNTPKTTRGRLDFKKDFVKALEEVEAAWPEIDLHIQAQGISLQPGLSSVPRA